MAWYSDAAKLGGRVAKGVLTMGTSESLDDVNVNKGAANETKSSEAWRHRASKGYKGAQVGAQGAQDYTQGAMQQQSAAAELMRQAALGQQPSQAQLQLDRGLQQAIMGQYAMAQSNPSVNPALAARLAAQQGSQMQLDVNQQSAIMRAQEMAAARAAYSQATQGMSQTGLQQQQLFNSMMQYYMQQGMSAAEANRMARMQMELGAAGIGLQSRGQDIGLMGSGIGAAGTGIAAMSKGG